MSQAVQIRKVETASDYRAFFEFPWALYQHDPNWIPPLLSQRRELLSKEKNPAWQYMEGDYFTAWRGAELVGTIAAFVNHRHNEYNQEHIGWFGAFEVKQDAEAATALLDTAIEWVQSRGYDAIKGPQTFTTHEETGLLVDNFSPPILLMPYNPPYYQTFIENHGLQKVMDIYSVYYDRQIDAEAKAGERLKKLVERASTRNGITVRPIDLKRKKDEFRLFRDIYNDAWIENWGFVPMTDPELDALIESLGQFFDPSMAFFAEINGEAVGFSLSIPNLNEVLQKAYPRPGVPEIWSLLQAVWYWKVRRTIRGVRQPLMGVRKAHRNKGVELALVYATFEALINSQYDFLDSGWILETNPLVDIVQKLGAKLYKTHRYYEKRF